MNDYFLVLFLSLGNLELRAFSMGDWDCRSHWE